MRRRRLHVTSTDPERLQGDLRATNRQDSIDAPARWRRQHRDIQKIIFLAPRKYPIDLFGPLANQRMLNRLHVASRGNCKSN